MICYFPQDVAAAAAAVMQGVLVVNQSRGDPSHIEVALTLAARAVQSAYDAADTATVGHRAEGEIVESEPTAGIQILASK